MSRRYNYLDGDRLYSDVLNVDSSIPKNSVNYYKKVEKTTRKTVTDDGDNPRTRVESTTIIKENDNPEQITKRVYTSGGNYEGRNLESGDYGNSNGYEVYSKRFGYSSSKDDRFTVKTPSYLNSNNYQSNTYKTSGTVQTTKNIITTTTSTNKTYNLGSSSLNDPKNTGYISMNYRRNEYSKNSANNSNRGTSYGDKKSYSSVRKNEYSNNIKIIDNTDNGTNEDYEDNKNTYLAKANALLANTNKNVDDATNRINSYLSSIKSITETEKRTTSILDNQDNSNSYLAKANAILGNSTGNQDNTYLAKANAILGNTTETENRVTSILDNQDNSNTYLAKANAILGNSDYKNNLDNEENNNTYTKSYSKYSSYKSGGNTYSNNVQNDNKDNSSSIVNKYGTGVETRSYSYGNKDKYTFAGTVKEKDNYMYYASGVGYVNKSGEPIKQEVNETTTIRSVSQSTKPIIRDERTSIKIETVRSDEKGELIDNYNYKESKDTTNKGKDSIVIHRRLGDPFYQNILEERRRYQSLTHTYPGRGSMYSSNEKDYSSYFLNSNRKRFETEKNDKYNNRTVNTRSLIDTSKYLNKNTTSSIKGSTSKYRTDNGRDNRSSRITTIEKRTEIQSKTENTPKRQYNVTTSSSQGRRKNVPPTYKTYEEKTEENYKKEKKQYDSNLGQENYDTEKDKGGKDTYNQYEQTTERKYQEQTNETYQQPSLEEQQNNQKQYQQEVQETYQVEPLEQNYEKEGTTEVQYGTDINALSQNYKQEGASSLQYIQEKQNQEDQEGLEPNQYGQEGEGQEEQYGQEGEGQDDIDQNQYGQEDLQDQYGQYEQYEPYGEYGEYEEYDDQYGEYGPYGQELEDMEQGYQMKENIPYKYKNLRRRRRMDKGSLACPVHGLNEQGKYGRNSLYEENRKEIRRYDGMEEGKNKFGSARNLGGRGRRIENRYEYIEKVNNEQGEREVDNYQFYETKNLSKKTSSVSVQNLINRNESNINSLNLKTLVGRGNMSIDGAGTGFGVGMGGSIQSSQTSEYSKIYLATKVTPVYSELANQQQLLKISGAGSQFCSICGARLSSLGQISSNTQRIINVCPLHGCM